MNDLFQKEEVLPYMKGLWREALQSICHVPSEVFSKKHQSCPSCGGKDRFRWTDKLEEPGDGGAYCNSCGADKGIGWLMRLTGEPYTEVVNILGRFLGKVPQDYRIKANKRASRDSGYNFGAQADHETCVKAMDRTEKASTTPLTMYESLPGESFDVGVKPNPDGSSEQIHAIPFRMVHKGEVDDEMCNILFINAGTGDYKFLARDYTRGSVNVSGSGSGAIYLVCDWVDAVRVAEITNQETWCCLDASNMEIVAHRYGNSGRELRIACRSDDMESLYVADERRLRVIIPNGSTFKTGARRKLYDPELIIDGVI
ncbi:MULTISPECIES: primase-helicase zinc-binding domain-containing protein [Gammaproteobacteria]|uniref:primase-helicase zinc-binding domain-containing protein n=1 Tax=Gammaproteobacteria TaxID=1236 RepID=UPI002FC799B6